jgi:hypothetical protein
VGSSDDLSTGQMQPATGTVLLLNGEVVPIFRTVPQRHCGKDVGDQWVAVFTARFQHGDRLTGIGKTTGEDGSGGPGTDHDEVEEVS